jgi:Fe2+ or Zn2+ uptake regulation protein
MNTNQNPTPENLRDIGLKATGPRMKILDFFHQNSGTHFSAEDVFMALAKEIPRNWSWPRFIGCSHSLSKHGYLLT